MRSPSPRSGAASVRRQISAAAMLGCQAPQKVHHATSNRKSPRAEHFHENIAVTCAAWSATRTFWWSRSPWMRSRRSGHAGSNSSMRDSQALNRASTRGFDASVARHLLTRASGSSTRPARSQARHVTSAEASRSYQTTASSGFDGTHRCQKHFQCAADNTRFFNGCGLDEAAIVTL